MTVSNVKTLSYFTEKLIVLVVLKQFKNHLGYFTQKRLLFLFNRDGMEPGHLYF